MSDFDAFETAQQEADPAADFLAKEQDQLAGIEDEDFGFTNDESAQPPADDFGFTEQAEDSEQQAQQAFDPFSGGTTDFLGGGGEDQPQQIPGLDDLDERLQQEEVPSDPYSFVKQVDTERAEPEKIRIWREEQVKRLEEKDADEAQKMIEWREQASKELEDWYKHRNEQLDKTKSSNREGEAEFIRERDDTVPGHEWERICRVCEFNPKASRNTRDVSRMRGILLQLKQNPLVKST